MEKPIDKLPQSAPTGGVRTRETFSHVTPDELVETLFVSGRNQQLFFAVYSTVAKQITLTESLSLDANTKLKAPQDVNSLISQGIVLFPSEVSDYGRDAELDRRLITYFRRWVDVEPFWEQLFVAYVKLTWAFDFFSAVPYLRFLGEYQSGKTRMAHVVASICYRSMSAAGAITSAVMFRLIHLFQGTLFLDEADFKDSALWSDLIKVLNAGYKKGGAVLRCNADNVPEAFQVYGPKIITTRKPFQDRATESRCITLEVHEKKVRAGIPFQLPAAFDVEAQQLRNKLLMWRFRNYHKLEYDESRLRTAGLESRVIEIATPLAAVSEPAFVTELIDFLSRRTAYQRAEKPQAFIVGGMRAIAREKGHTEDTTSWEDKFAVKDIAQQASLLKLQQEPDAAREAMAQARPYGDEVQYFTARRTGSLLRSMGFKPERTRDGENTGYHIALRSSRLKELVDQFDPPDFEKEPEDKKIVNIDGKV